MCTVLVWRTILESVWILKRLVSYVWLDRRLCCYANAGDVLGEVPTGNAKSVRYKDRACYRHQVCRVDLTSVFSSVRSIFKYICKVHNLMWVICRIQETPMFHLRDHSSSKLKFLTSQHYLQKALLKANGLTRSYRMSLIALGCWWRIYNYQWLLVPCAFLSTMSSHICMK